MFLGKLLQEKTMKINEYQDYFLLEKRHVFLFMVQID